MMRILLLLLLVALQPTYAATRTLTVLGDQKIKTKWDGDMPKAMKDSGIETDVTGIIIADGKLIPTFGFGSSNKKKVLKVQVDDVTGNSPVTLVTDSNPVLAEQRWKGDATPRELTPEGVPWLYTAGATLTVYRFTVHLEGLEKPIVIFQPSVFRESSKERLRIIAEAIKNSPAKT